MISYKNKSHKLLAISQKRSAFTLIELMVVITIITILAAIGLVSFTRVQRNARDGRRKADLKALETALAMYATEHNGEVMIDTHSGWEQTNNPQGDIDQLIPDYMKRLPIDPKNSGVYHYYFDPQSIGGSWMYAMYANLENTSDPEISRSQAACSAISLPCPAGSGVYCICGP